VPSIATTRTAIDPITMPAIAPGARPPLDLVVDTPLLCPPLTPVFVGVGAVTEPLFEPVGPVFEVARLEADVCMTPEPDGPSVAVAVEAEVEIMKPVARKGYPNLAHIEDATVATPVRPGHLALSTQPTT